MSIKRVHAVNARASISLNYLRTNLTRVRGQYKITIRRSPFDRTIFRQQRDEAEDGSGINNRASEHPSPNEVDHDDGNVRELAIALTLPFGYSLCQNVGMIGGLADWWIRNDALSCLVTTLGSITISLGVTEEGFNKHHEYDLIVAIYS